MFSTKTLCAPRSWLGRFSMGALLLFALISGCKPAKFATAAPGDDLFAIASDMLLEFTYRTPAARVTAQRFNGAAPFQLTMSTAAGDFEHCQGGPKLGSALAELSGLRVEARLSDQTLANLAGELLIFGPTLMEPFHAGVLPVTSSSGDRLTLAIHGTAYRVSAQQYTLDRLLKGCKEFRQTDSDGPASTQREK